MTEKLLDVSPAAIAASQQPAVEELETARELVRQGPFTGCRTDRAAWSAQGVDQDGDRDRAG